MSIQEVAQLLVDSRKARKASSSIIPTPSLPPSATLDTSNVHHNGRAVPGWRWFTLPGKNLLVDHHSKVIRIVSTEYATMWEMQGWREYAEEWASECAGKKQDAP